MLLCLSSAGPPGRWSAQSTVYFADDVTFDAAYDLASGFAFCSSPCGVGLGSLIIAHAHNGYAIDGSVCLPIAAAVQTHPVCLAAGGRDRADATQLGQGGFGMRVSDLLCMTDPVHASPKGSMND